MLFATLAGCAADPTAHDLPIVPAAFREAGSSRGMSAAILATPGSRWWSVFDDPRLESLVERADDRNATVRQSIARLAQARASAHGADARRLPQLVVQSSASRQSGPLINAAGGSGTLFNGGLSLTHDVDLLGRLSKLAGAAALDVEASEALVRHARVIVQTETAQTYFTLRALDEERALVRATADSYRTTLGLVERRRGAGLASDQQVERMKAEVGATDAEALALDRRRADAEHGLAVLIGETATSFRVDPLDVEIAVPAIPSGIPATVLARRADVRAAERTMQAAATRLGVAQTAWFPTLTLTASRGYASTELGQLITASASGWGLASLVAGALFDGGRREALVEGARADLELAHATYREQILIALRDVEDQLAALRLLADQAASLRITVDAATRAAAQSESLYRRGLTAQLELLDARRTELRDRRAAVQVRAARLASTIALVRALGGGWNDESPLQGLVAPMPDVVVVAR